MSVDTLRMLLIGTYLVAKILLIAQNHLPKKVKMMLIVELDRMLKPHRLRQTVLQMGLVALICNEAR